MKTAKQFLSLQLVLLASLLSVFSFAQPTQQWIYNYNGTANQLDYGRAVRVDDSGNAFIAGTVSNSGTAKDIVVIKINSLGVQQWIATYNGTANLDDWAYALVIDSAGNSYAAGFTSTPSSGKNFLTVKFDSSGIFQWAQEYNGTGNQDDAVNHMAIDPWGNVAVTGISKGTGTADDYATVKYSSAGIQLWVARYDGPASGVDDARTIASDLSGNFYVSGGSNGIGSDYDFATVKYDSSGAQQWVARYNGPENVYDLVYYQGSVIVDSLFNVYVTGYSTGLDSTLDYTTIKYDSSGNQLWVQRFSTLAGGTDYADAIWVDDSLNVYVTGGSDSSSSNYDFATIKYNSSGVQQWVAYYNGTGNNWDEAYGVMTDDSLNVYVLGRSPGATTSADFVTIKYSPSGNQIWEMRYAHNGYDWPFTIRMSPDRSVYVGGWTSPSNGMADFTVIKYSQVPVGIENVMGEKIRFDLFPNPSDGKFTVEMENVEKGVIEIYDVLGEMVFHSEITSPKSELIMNLPNGIYFYQLKETAKVIDAGKIIVQ